MPPNNQIVINYIPDPDYARLKAEAEALRISLNNLARRRLHIPEARPGNPTGNRKRVITQPKGKKRGVRRTKEEIEQAKLVAAPNPEWTPESGRKWEAELARMGEDAQ